MILKIKELSATRIKQWLECKYKYGCNYHKFHPEVVKVRPVWFRLGTAVHEALEYAGKLIVDEKLNKFEEEHKKGIIQKYFDVIANESLDDTQIMADGLVMLKNKLNTFEFDYPILSLEDDFHVEIEGVPVRGAMDRVVELEPGHVCIIDYKTSKTALTDMELFNDLQVGTYDIVARQKYPDAKEVTVCLDYLRLVPKTVTITPEKRESNIALIKSVYTSIKEAKKKDLKPLMHEFCPWCEFASVCPAMKKAAELSDNDEVLVSSDLEELSDAYFKAKTLAKYNTLRKDKLGNKIKSILSNKNIRTADTGTYKLSTRQNAYVRYNIPEIVRVLSLDRLVKCIDIKKQNFENEAKKVGLTEEQLTDIREVNFSKSILSVTPKKSK